MALDSATRSSIDRQIAAFNEQVRGVRADPMLSELGKAQRIRKLHEAANTTVSQLRGQAEASSYSRRQALERRLFGLPAGADANAVIIYRDAVDRVGAIRDPAELAEVMERAAATGDAVMLKVAARHALDHTRGGIGSDRWDELVATYVEDTGATQDFTEYRELTSTRGRTAAFEERMSTSVPMPHELTGTAPLSNTTAQRRPDFEATPAIPAGAPLRDPNPAV